MKRVARFTPQAWINDYAVVVDPAGPTEWDVTEHLSAMTEEDAARAMEEDTWGSDDLRNAAGAPQWIKEWSGPFYISVEEVEA